MKKDDLFNYVKLFQNTIIKCKDKLSVEFQSFPCGSCGTTCLLLGTFLAENCFVNLKMKIGEKNDSNGQEYSHAWLETDNSFIIDITAYQFPEITEKIIFGKKPSWYDEWIVTEEIEDVNLFVTSDVITTDFVNYEILMENIYSLDKVLEQRRSRPPQVNELCE